MPALPNRVEVNVNVSHEMDSDHYMIPQPSPSVSFTDSPGTLERGQLRGFSFDSHPESTGEMDLKAMSLTETHYYCSGDDQHA